MVANANGVIRIFATIRQIRVNLLIRILNNV